MEKICKYCGEPYKTLSNIECCSAECWKNHKYAEAKRRRFFNNMLKRLARRKAINDGLSGFNSITGLSQNPKKSVCIINQDEYEQLGLQAVFDGSIFHWNKQTKALYIQYEDKYLALTSEF